MNVTSMLSSGYLQPYHEALQPVKETANAASAVAAERNVLAQEKALKAASGPDAEVSTTYTYTTGPDGRRYITGAVVSIKGGNQQGGGRGKVELSGGAVSAEDNNKAASTKPADSDPAVDAEVRKLQQTEREVVAHEAAHQAAGGALAGAVSYTYTKGPDGKSYITGGEVPISMPTSSGDPAETIRNMAQVQRAALAPGSPSGPDLSVAAQAAAMASAARQELAAKNRESVSGGSEKGEEAGKSAGFSSGVSSVKAGLLFGKIHGQNYGKEVSTSEELAKGAVQDPTVPDPVEAYAQNASAYGLWTTMRGFEPAQKNVPFKPALNIAA